MSAQTSPIEELVSYKKAVLKDDRRDSRIRRDIEETLDFLSKRKSSFIGYNSNRSSTASNTPFADSAMASQDQIPVAMTYQIPRTQYPSGPKGDLESARTSATFIGDSHGGDSHDHDKHEVQIGHVTLKDRLRHFTWAWYASTMSTGGVAFVLSVIPNRPDFLFTVGTVVYIINIILFLTITTTMVIRFTTCSGTFKKSLSNPHEGFFFATFWLTIATMMTNATAYGIPNTGPWLVDALRIAFWIYTVCATILATVHYPVLFHAKALVITNVLPGWILPIFPAMLVGTLASAIAKFQTAENALPMLVCGLAYQGLGMMLALAMYGIYFGRLMTQDVPVPASRPAMFIAVGPPSFTALALIGMAQDVATTKIFESGSYTLLGIQNQALISDILQILALLVSISLIVFAFWAFAIAAVANIESIPRNDFHLNWYANVFPNVGFTIAVIKIGERLTSPAIQLVGTAMAAVLFFLWLLVVFCHIKAVKNHMICWPGKDEDAH